MGMALYRKYRSKSLDEIVGQAHITTALSNALKTGKISHAYLLTGPKGVGKTSVARILAYEVNQIPYDEDATHLDIIEIDAASNRRIDEIRELRERVHNAPASAKYKVYIIDEVHMLTREAFNALLKTLEEPPEHAIFILATTEAHKLPETIVSRTQRYTFRPIDLNKVKDHLKSIAKQEKIKISDEALELIARHGDGSFRDSISLLDQVRHHADKIELETVQQTLGIAPEEVIDKIMTALAHGSSADLLATLGNMEVHGYHAAQVAKQLGESLRKQLLEHNGQMPPSRIASLLKELLNVPTAQDSGRLLELILLESALAITNNQPKIQSPKPVNKQPRAETSAPTETETKPVKPTSEHMPQTEGLDKTSWQLVLQSIKARHNTLYSVTRMAVPTFKNGELVLAFSFPFHQKRLNDAKNRQVIQDVIKQTTGEDVTITCIVDASVRTKPAAVTAPADDMSLEAISNIFGPPEVLE